MTVKRYGRRPHPKNLKSKSAWKKLDREVMPGETPFATATIRIRNREVEYDLYHAAQTWEA